MSLKMVFADCILNPLLYLNLVSWDCLVPV